MKKKRIKMSKKGRFRSLEANQKLMFTLRDRKRKKQQGEGKRIVKKQERYGKGCCFAFYILLVQTFVLNKG